MSRFILFMSLMLVSAGVCAAEGFPEPFGLTWGMSDAALIKLGFTRPSTDSGPLHLFISEAAPKPWSEAETYAVVTYNDQLVKVMAVSKSFTDDIAGDAGKAAYAKLNDVLTRKYGKPADHMEVIGTKLYTGFDEFYQCLNYAGCGVYFTSYHVAGGTIGVNLVGQSRGKGYLKVSYESPAFEKALEQIKEKTSTSDADAF